jgi:hypothetical protein
MPAVDFYTLQLNEISGLSNGPYFDTFVKIFILEIALYNNSFPVYCSGFISATGFIEI